MNSHHAARSLIIRATFYTGTHNKYPPLPPVSSDSYDFGPVHSEHGCHGVVLPVFPCVTSLSAPPCEPGELLTPLSRTQTETHADSKEQEEQKQKKKPNQWVICVLELSFLLGAAATDCVIKCIRRISYLFVEFLQSPLLLSFGLLQLAEGLFEHLLFFLGSIQMGV